MSDVIREAFEAHVRSSQYTTGGRIGENYANPLTQRDWEIWQAACAALQSQTAPAVPDGWKVVPVEPTKDMLLKSNWSGNGDVSVNEEWARKTVWDRMLAAAPQPDNSPDAGKVVQVSPAGWIWDAYGSRHFTYGCHHKEVLEADGLTLTPVYTHPAESREEIQAQALEPFAREHYDLSSFSPSEERCFGRQDLRRAADLLKEPSNG